MFFPAPKMIGILGSDTTKDGNPLCFFVVVGSACAVESNHRNRWRFRKLWIFKFCREAFFQGFFLFGGEGEIEG